MLNSLFYNPNFKTFIYKSISYSKCAKRLVLTHSVRGERVRIYFKIDPLTTRLGLIKIVPNHKGWLYAVITRILFSHQCKSWLVDFFQKPKNLAAFFSQYPIITVPTKFWQTFIVFSISSFITLAICQEPRLFTLSDFQTRRAVEILRHPVEFLSALTPIHLHQGV